MNDDETRALRHEANYNDDEEIIDLCDEVLRRGEVIATYRALVSKMAVWGWSHDDLTPGERELLEGETP